MGKTDIASCSTDSARSLKMNNSSYKYYTVKHAKKSPLAKDAFFAFLFGGIICTIAELLLSHYKYLGITDDNAWAKFRGVTLE